MDQHAPRLGKNFYNEKEGYFYNEKDESYTDALPVSVATVLMETGERRYTKYVYVMRCILNIESTYTHVCMYVHEYACHAIHCTPVAAYIHECAWIGLFRPGALCSHQTLTKITSESSNVTRNG